MRNVNAKAPELYWLAEDDAWNERLTRLRETHLATAEDFRAAALRRIDFVQTMRLDRLLRKWASVHNDTLLRRVRLAVLSNATVEHLTPGVRVAGIRRGLLVETYTTDYGQYLQELSDATSGLYAFAPEAVLFAFDSEHLLGGWLLIEEGSAAVERAVARCRGLWRVARERFGAQVLQQCVLPAVPALIGQNEHRMTNSAAHLVHCLNHQLRMAAEADGVQLLALDEWALRDGLCAWRDELIWRMAKQEVTPAATPVYGDLTARLLAAHRGLSSKCLVLDLDNTLWGGVIGDDGLDGIVLGHGSSAGESFVAFQHYAKALSRRGVILAVCSKNDECNARLPFEKHPEMSLRIEDIACFVANWDDKASNLRRIAERLRIGIDSLVFVDDSPFERSFVRRELPEVATLEMPAEPALWPYCLADAGYFEALLMTREDYERADSYQANQHREVALRQSLDLPSYLRDLQMELSSSPFDIVGLPRIMQLIHKTNQFNLTTRRCSEEEVNTWVNDANTLTMQLRLRDRFGDNGVIALVAGTMDTAYRLMIDLWLMSCRVLGRSVEEETMNRIVAEAQRMGARELIGVYRPSERNRMVREHYSRMGFTVLSADPDGTTFWRMDLMKEHKPLSNFINSISTKVTT